MNVALLAVLFPVTALLSANVSAQNLLVNPDFDTDLSGWSGIGSWSQLDAWGSPSSGSATWINSFPSGGAAYLDQCVELAPFFEGYDLSG
jgi:hypothetical protein